MTKADQSITIVIPTYNGEDYLDDIIKAIFKQDIDMEYDLLIIDSGSTDGTLDIIRRHMKKKNDIRLHVIPNNEFGHGKTRQLAATLANGEYIVYLSHDAIPAHNRWLYEMVRPMVLSPKIVGVMGRQTPRANCPPLLKYDIIRTFAQFGPEYGVTIFYKDDFIKDQATYDVVRFYSDVNSATRRSVLLGDIPYRDVKYAEDQLFGEDILEAGLIKAYSPRGLVVHSNDVRLRDYHKRIFDEMYGLKKNGVDLLILKRGFGVKAFAGGVIRQSISVIFDKSYSAKRKIYWLVVNPVFIVQKFRGYYLAKGASLEDSHTDKSLEASRKT